MMVGRSAHLSPSAARRVGLLALAVACLGCAMFGARFAAPGAWVMAVILAAAMTASLVGFAFSALSGAVLFHLVGDPVRAVQIMLVCSIANQAAMTWVLRRRVCWRDLGVFLLGGALGLPLGVWLLLHAERQVYATGFGACLVGCGAWMLLHRPAPLRWQHPAFDCASAMLSGVSAGAVAFPSFFVGTWCSYKGWDKVRQRALLQPFILVMQLATILVISLASHKTVAGDPFDCANLLCVPASLLGTSVGMGLSKRISEVNLVRAVNVLLIVSGLSYLL